MINNMLLLTLFNTRDLLDLFLLFSFNFLVIFIVARLLYYRVRRRRDYLFTYLMISSVVFMLCFLLQSVTLQLGFALGLFAVFGIIRYRTLQIPIKEMTYLFLVIGLSVINALGSKQVTYAELLLTNALVLFVTYGLERMMMLRHESKKIINYEKIDLIKPEARQQLIEDLEARTGLKINRIEVGKIDFLRDVARLNVYYFEDENLADDEDTYFNDSEENR